MQHPCCPPTTRSRALQTYVDAIEQMVNATILKRFPAAMELFVRLSVMSGSVL